MQYNRDFPRTTADNLISEGVSNSFNNQKNTVLNDNNARVFFQKSSSSGYVSFSDGKVKVKTFGFLDKIGYAFIIIGFVLVLFMAHGLNQGLSFSFISLIVVILLLIVGFLTVLVVKTFSVVDYKSRTIYTETDFRSICIWKTRRIPIADISNISIDNRPVESSVQNIGMSSQASLIHGEDSAHRRVSNCDSAIAFLLKNGKLIHFTEFTNNTNLRETYIVFATEFADAFNINYKANLDDYKLVVRKVGNRYCLGSENYREITSDSILMSIARIMIGIIFIVGTIYLVFYLIYKYV